MPARTTTRRSAHQRDEESERVQRAVPSREPARQARISVPVPVPAIRMPSGTAGNIIWWGGLAAVAALGVVDWPVAAIVAAGTWVAGQRSREAAQHQSTQAQRPRAAAA